MTKQRLSLEITSTPDFGALRFYVEAGKRFDASDYASAYGLRVSDISQRDIKAAEVGAERLEAGEWLEVTHENA